MSKFNDLLSWLKKTLHIHQWETTHTNQWYHPTRQKCGCSLVREFKYKSNADEINGMPWTKGEWVWSDGTVSTYCTND